jgi:predicted GIY-YIG superfamily endonuclease
MSSVRHFGPDDRCAVYRLYDTAEKLLYIGASHNPKQRWRDHRKEKPWRERMASMTIQWYPDRATAESAEREAIAREDPEYNVRDTPRFAEVCRSAGAARRESIRRAIRAADSEANARRRRWLARKFEVPADLVTAEVGVVWLLDASCRPGAPLVCPGGSTVIVNDQPVDIAAGQERSVYSVTGRYDVLVGDKNWVVSV